MKCKAFIKSLSILLLFSVTLFWNSLAWSWGINDQQFILQETVTFNGSGGSMFDTIEYEHERYFNDGPMVNLFAGGVTDYALPNQYTTTCSGESTFGEPVSYSVSGNGSIVFTFSDGTMDGALSADSNTIIYSGRECSDTDQYCSMIIGAGVKRGVDKSTSDLFGTFAVYEFESGFHSAETTWIDETPNGWGMSDEQFLIKSNMSFNGSTGIFSENLQEYRHNRRIMDGPITNLFDSGTTDYALPNQYTMNCEGPINESGETGTFSVVSDGEVTINFFEDGSWDSITAFLSNNENVLVFSESECSNEDKYCSMGIGIGVKRGSGVETGDLAGTFTVYEFESGFHGGETNYAWGNTDQLFLLQSVITFNGTGGFVVNSLTEYEHERQIVDGPPTDLFSGGIDDYALPNKHITTCQHSTDSGETGTYTVSLNGNVTINFYQDDSITGVLSIDGNVLILSSSECDNNDRYCSMALGVGVKQGDAMDNNSLNGVYKAGALETGFHGGAPKATTPTINPGVLQLLLLPGI